MHRILPISSPFRKSAYGPTSQVALSGALGARDGICGHSDPYRVSHAYMSHGRVHANEGPPARSAVAEILQNQATTNLNQ
jgi:hypothetical protein